MVEQSVKKVLVTGATGFLGAHVVRSLLAANHGVVAGVRRDSDVWRLRDVKKDISTALFDLLEPQTMQRVLAEQKPQAIINCAVYGVDYSQQNSDLLLKTNVVGTYRLVEAAAQAQVERFIQVGSCFEYGTKDYPIEEIELLAPESFYGATKSAASLIAAQRAKVLGLPLVIVRPFGLWGALEGFNRLVPQIVLAAIDKKPLNLTGGRQIRDYTYVSDAADALSHLVGCKDFPSGQIFNIGSGQEVLLKTFVTDCARHLNAEDILCFGALPYRPDEMWSLVANVQKWREFAGFDIAKTALSDGLEKAVVEIRSRVQGH